MDPELKALLATLATKDDLAKLVTKDEILALERKLTSELRSARRDLQRHLLDLARDVVRVDEKIDALRDDVRRAGVAA